MKIFSSLSPKRFFGSRKSRSHVSRSSSSSSSSAAGNGDSGTPTTVLPGEYWSDQANFDALKPKDKDRAGLLVSIDELEELLARLGAEPPSREEVAAMLGELGCDGGDGRVSIDALVSRVGSVCGPAGDVELRETFDFFDADRDGRITEAELLGALRALGDERCTLEDCRRMIAVVDENGDGFVCFADFSRMMELHG